MTFYFLLNWKLLQVHAIGNLSQQLILSRLENLSHASASCQSQSLNFPTLISYFFQFSHKRKNIDFSAALCTVVTKLTGRVLFSTFYTTNV